MESSELAHLIASFSIEKKAENVNILNLTEITTITDYFVICSADTDIQVKSIGDHIKNELKKQDIKIWHLEGYQQGEWLLLDLVDVVVHIFQPETREFFGLEKLWGDAKITKVEDK